MFKDYYNINSYGLWEKGNYVLIKNKSDLAFCTQHSINPSLLSKKVLEWKKILLVERGKRSKPRLDDKTLTSWNALMLKGYIDAYRVFGDKTFLDAALKNANFIKNKQLKKDHSLFHSYKNGKSTINAYLEDYALVAEAFITLYQSTFDQQWLEISNQLTEYALLHFFEQDSTIFYFTSDQDPDLVTRTIEYQDNVIPASNSVMAKNLFLLSHYFDRSDYKKISKRMLHDCQSHIKQYPSGYSNWLDLMLNYTFNFYELVVVGSEMKIKIDEVNKFYIPNKLLAGSKYESETALLKNRYTKNKTLIYVCQNSSCKYPQENTSEALDLITN